MKNIIQRLYDKVPNMHFKKHLTLSLTALFLCLVKLILTISKYV